jgi:hypothetical protein
MSKSQDLCLVVDLMIDGGARKSHFVTEQSSTSNFETELVRNVRVLNTEYILWSAYERGYWYCLYATQPPGTSIGKQTDSTGRQSQ